MGNRVAKIVKPIDGNGDLTEETEWSYTYYARDAQGNVMGVYEQKTGLDKDGNYEKDFNITERPIYGASRVGQNNQEINLYKRVFEGYVDQTTISQQIIETNLLSESLTAYNEELKARVVDGKVYELSNHLGNVLTVISDRRKAEDEAAFQAIAGGEYNYIAAIDEYEYVGPGLGTHDKTTGTDGLVDKYRAKIHSVSDYYPYGMLMPGRNKQSEEYRYGYQGSEKDDEVKGDGNSYTTHFRQLDTRLGRWLSIDPMSSEFPWQSPYASMDNNPVLKNDVLGLYGSEGEVKEAMDKAKARGWTVGDYYVVDGDYRFDGRIDDSKYGGRFMEHTFSDETNHFGRSLNVPWQYNDPKMAPPEVIQIFNITNTINYESLPSEGDLIPYIPSNYDPESNINGGFITFDSDELSGYKPEVSMVGLIVTGEGVLWTIAVGYTENYYVPKYATNPKTNYAPVAGSSAELAIFEKFLGLFGGAYAVGDKLNQARIAWFEHGDGESAVKQLTYAAGYATATYVSMMPVPGARIAGLVMVGIVGVFDYFNW